MAQYLREPLLVLDVNEHNDAHMQRYMYTEYRLADGTDHASGYIDAHTDRAAQDYLYECWRLHVMPTFLILHHQNATSQECNTSNYFSDEMRKVTQAMSLCLILHGEDIDLSEINVLERNDAIDAVLTNKLPTNEHLKIVLTRLGLLILDMHELDERKLDENIVEEERLIHEAYSIDGYASGSQVIPKETRMSNDWTELPKRAPRVATGAASEAAYSRLLGMADVREVEFTDHPKYDLICAANREAFTRWTNLYRAKVSIPLMKRTQTMSGTIRSWLLERHQINGSGYGFGYHKNFVETITSTSLSLLGLSYTSSHMWFQLGMQPQWGESQMVPDCYGFGATPIEHRTWLNSLGRQTAHGNQGLVLLQETHVHAEEIEEAQREHAARRDFRSGGGGRALSYWGAARECKDGVGILVNPFGAFKDVRPLCEEAWSPHLVAVINVYAPIEREAREKLFGMVARLTLPPHGRVFMGGDFNCTLVGQLDRAHTHAAHAHESPALRLLLKKWKHGTVWKQQCPCRVTDTELQDFIETSTPIGTLYTVTLLHPDSTVGMERMQHSLGLLVSK
ncbi:hypothetical protein PHMEG_00022409 [Phytophthora megakarya]|uniref:Endonuclease/exonuclease/phosphatase domain-containing protein n=1 Tax=Phytophthora megakarya TaxID=4795 RepID=A0A225VL50_9STRA|nr:hypothetical protein PHMEG_00022409 [Phytophthora megakarya]